LDETNGFQLDLKKLEAAIQKPCIVYLPNPNNPTGNLLVTRDEIIDLVERYPKNTFWVDEAYVQYMDPKVHQPVSDLVPKHDNLFVSRSFSFAYGLAGIHVGYLIAPESFIERMEKKSTPYRVGKLQESVVVTALQNADEHLRDVRALCAQEQARIGEVLDQIDGITWYPSSANFILCKWPDTNTTTKFLADMLEMANHFRITLGLAEDTDKLLEALQAVTHYRGSEVTPPSSQQAASEDAKAVGV
jgi:histidinol-phosphate aminotransferase